MARVAGVDAVVRNKGVSVHRECNVDLDDLSSVLAAYGSNYDRLRALKTEYDPTNLFRLNQNIPPGP
ncbi:MAG: BBE domain-containing protein [Candidatus Rokuibacteriota bacterium]